MSVNRGLLLRLAASTAVLAAGWFFVHATLVPTVVVTAVRRGTAVLSATGNVTVLPALDTRVVAPAQGILVKFKLKEGDTVKAGEVIAEIDRGNWPFLLNDNRIDLDRITLRLAQGSPDDIQLDQLKKTYEKNLELAKTGSFRIDDLEHARRDIEQLEFKLRQDRGDLEYTRTKLQNKIEEIREEIDRRSIKAGYDGVIMNPSVLQGDLVMQGAGLCNLTSRNKIFRAEVNQDDLDAVRKSHRVLVRLFSQGDTVFEGKTTQVLPIGNPDTQRFTVYIDLPHVPDTVLSGQTGEATFIADEHPGALLIPRKALIGSECFVLKGDRLEQRKVKVGYTTLTDAEILKGLSPGDLVVSQDADLRRDNEKVRPATAAGDAK